MDANIVPSIKCVLIGDYNVGKSSLINAFATREPLNSYFLGLNDPIQVHVEHVYRLYLLNIHDTEGVHPPSPKPSPALSSDQDEPDEFHLNLSDKSHSDSSQKGSDEAKLTSRRVEYGLADVILVCFSLANRASFENVETVWCNELRQLCPHVPFLVVGCKLDLRRPDPTTPALVRSPRQTQSSKFPFRRPKFTRSSTASTIGSDAPGSPSSPASDSGHLKGESSSTQPTVSSMQNSQQALSKLPSQPPTKPVGILTNNTPPSSYPGNSDPSQAPSDTEGSGKKLRSKSSFNVALPRGMTFRRKSTLDVPTSSSASASAPPTIGAAPRSTSSSKTPQQTNISAAQSSKESDPTITAAVGSANPTLTTGPTAAHSAHSAHSAGPTSSTTRSRHVNLPPFMRSISHATVFRRVLNRSRSGTRADAGGQGQGTRIHSGQSGQESKGGQIGNRDVSISPTSRKSATPAPTDVPGGASSKSPEPASVKTGAGSGPGAKARVGNASATGPNVPRIYDELGGDDSVGAGGKLQDRATDGDDGEGGKKSAGEATSIGGRLETGGAGIGSDRPVLVQRFTSGSADDGSTVMKIHSHIRTNSQPQPSPITSPLSSSLSSPSMAATTTTTATPSLTLGSPDTHSSQASPPSPPRHAGTTGTTGVLTTSPSAKGKGKGKGKGEEEIVEPVASSTGHHEASSIDYQDTYVSQVSQHVLPPEISLSSSPEPPPTPSPTRKHTRIEEPNLPPRYRPTTTSFQEARSTARRLGACGYIECSALTLVNVVDVFDLAVRVAVERRNASASSLHRTSRRNDDCVLA